MEFSHKLKELRQGRGISQAELADAIHVSRSAVAKWENGLGMPNKESADMIANYFGISTEQLLSANEENSKRRMSEQDKKVVIRAVVISVGVFLVLTLGGIFIEPLEKVFSSASGAYIALIIVNVANILRIRAQRKKEEEKDKNEDGK